MSLNQLTLLCCGCLLWLFVTGCRAQTETIQQSTTNTTQQSSNTQAAVPNSNSTAVNQNVPAQNSNTTTQAAVQTKLDPCSLLTPSEITSVQGEEVKETKASPGNSSRLAVSQCFYQTTTPSKSVSLELTQGLNGQRGALSPRDFWDETFERADEERGRKEKGEKEKGETAKGNTRANEKEKEEEEGMPPRRITGVGEEAFWAGNARIGALYVLKGNSIIRISVGGIADQNARLEKTKTLAQAALKRLND